MRTFFLAAFAACVLTACGNSKSRENNRVDQVRFAPPVVKADAEVLAKAPDEVDLAKITDDAPPERPITDTAKKIIKYGDISFQTGNIKVTRKKILQSLKKLDGYVAEDNETHDDDSSRQEYTLKMRLPAKSFGLLLDSVSSTAARIDLKEIRIKDVTSQFIDIKAQLTNSHTLENTYLGLLKKADKMSDVLQIENKITEIRTVIDSTQGNLNYLSRQVAYSSLDVTFYTKQAQVENEDTAGSKFRTAISRGWETLQNLFFGLISLWPLLLVTGFFYLLVRRWWRQRRLSKQAQ